MRGVELHPADVLAEVRVWLARSPQHEKNLFTDGRRGIRLSDGRMVRHDERPGWLVIDGLPRYSAAWL